MVLSLIACGGSDRGTGSGSGRGFTACGDKTCQPGQYCDSVFDVCENGCLSDTNCAENQFCDTDNPDINGVSQCMNMTMPTADAGPPTGNALEECRAACAHFQSCGLPAADAAQCSTDCGGLSEEQQRAIGRCDGLACGEVPGCLGVDCIATDHCSAGQECVDYTCL